MEPHYEYRDELLGGGLDSHGVRAVERLSQSFAGLDEVSDVPVVYVGVGHRTTRHQFP